MSTIRPLPRAALAAAVLALAACASAGGRSPSVFDTPPAAGPDQSCSGGRWTAGLPPVGRLLDSAAVASHAAGLPRGHTVWEVRWDSTGAPDSVRAVVTDLGGSLLDGARGSVRGAMRTVAPETDTVRVPGEGARERPRRRIHLLRVDTGDSVALRLAESEECIPVLANRAAIQFRLMQEFRQAMAGSGQARRTLVLQAWVRADGAPEEVEIARSSGISRVDRLALDLGRTMRFTPARLNRRPVGVRVTIPFELIVGRGRGDQGDGWRDASSGRGGG